MRLEYNIDIDLGQLYCESDIWMVLLIIVSNDAIISTELSGFKTRYLVD
jgi:hypothetical protein